MNLPNLTFSDYLVFVDESGDHGLTAVNRDFPLFALAFCTFACPMNIGSNPDGDPARFAGSGHFTAH